MKSCILLLKLILITLLGYSQTKIDTILPASNVDALEGDFNWGNLMLRSWDRNEIRMTANISINLGEDDEEFVWSLVEENGKLKLTTDIPDMDNLPQYLTLYRDGQKIYTRAESEDNPVFEELKEEGYSWISKGVIVEVEMEVFVPRDLTVTIKSVYGDVELQDCPGLTSIENTYGHIIARLPDHLLANDCSLTSTYSFVDASVDNDLSVDVTMLTNHGEIYSNVDLVIDLQQSKQEVFHTLVRGKVNEGGSALSIKSPYSNIYLRRNEN